MQLFIAWSNHFYISLFQTNNTQVLNVEPDWYFSQLHKFIFTQGVDIFQTSFTSKVNIFSHMPNIPDVFFFESDKSMLKRRVNFRYFFYIFFSPILTSCTNYVTSICFGEYLL